MKTRLLKTDRLIRHRDHGVNVASSKGQLVMLASTNLICQTRAVAQPCRLANCVEVNSDHGSRRTDLRAAQNTSARPEPRSSTVSPERAPPDRGGSQPRPKEPVPRPIASRLAREAQVFGEVAPDLQVKLGGLLACDLAVHLLDSGLELLGVDQQARVGLRQRLGTGHLVILCSPRAHRASLVEIQPGCVPSACVCGCMGSYPPAKKMSGSVTGAMWFVDSLTIQ